MISATKRTLFVTAMAILGPVTASPAVSHADDAGYLAKLQQDGVVIRGATPATLLSSGRYICSQLHHGHTPQDLVAGFEHKGRYMRPPAQVQAAQEELCPDTLPAAPGG